MGALCFVKVLGDERLNRSIVTCAHAPRQVASPDVTLDLSIYTEKHPAAKALSALQVRKTPS